MVDVGKDGGRRTSLPWTLVLVSLLRMCAPPSPIQWWQSIMGCVFISCATRGKKGSQSKRVQLTFCLTSTKTNESFWKELMCRGKGLRRHRDPLQNGNALAAVYLVFRVGNFLLSARLKQDTFGDGVFYFDSYIHITRISLSLPLIVEKKRTSYFAHGLWEQQRKVQWALFLVRISLFCSCVYDLAG